MSLLRRAELALAQTGRKTMRDQIDAEIWNDRHDQFSEYVDGLLAAAGRSLKSSGSLAGHAGVRVLVGLLAVSLTLAAFGASAA